MTRVPAQALGVGDRLGSIEPGKLADLVLWEGDPLDVGHYAEQVWLGGRAVPMRSRQTELRDRYLTPTEGALPKGLSDLIADPTLGPQITPDWVRTLSRIELRGKRPRDKQDWYEIYLHLKRILN